MIQTVTLVGSVHASVGSVSMYLFTAIYMDDVLD